MDRIAKTLKRLNPKERKLVKEILYKIKKENFEGLQVKKLKKRNDIFRVRKGDLRILYRKEKDKISILAIERKSENTYKKM
ncbi:hypothetical protein IIA94_02160 [Patescibacteria group bacterium]|nr:hypothetical protein [Patescibacteria group bacterium]